MTKLGIVERQAGRLVSALLGTEIPATAHFVGQNFSELTRPPPA